MNNDQVKGFVKNIVGKVQEEAGKLIGNKDLQAKGVKKQLSGKTQIIYGDAKEIAKKAKHP